MINDQVELDKVETGQSDVDDYRLHLSPFNRLHLLYGYGSNANAPIAIGLNGFGSSGDTP